MDYMLLSCMQYDGSLLLGMDLWWSAVLDHQGACELGHA